MNPGVPGAAYRWRSKIENTNCSVDQIVLHDTSGQPARGNPFGDGFAINWDGAYDCARAYVQSCVNLLVHTYDIDFLKMDAVTPGSGKNNATNWPIPPYNKYDNSRDVKEWSEALERTGKDVWLAISWEIDPDYAQVFAPYANSWRTSMDIDCYCDVLVKWPAVKRVFKQVVPWLPHAGHTRNTGRPDLDSLNLGNGGHSWGQGLSESEKQVYASFWDVAGAPIYTGADLQKLDAKEAEVLMSPALRAINAHPITAQPQPCALL